MQKEEWMVQARRHVDAGADLPIIARDPVNQPMVRRWCEAMGDRNPMFHDPSAAGQQGFPRGVAPPAMLDVWTMEPYDPRQERAGDLPVFDLLTQAGFTGTVATNVEQEYDRYLETGDVVGCTVRVAEVSEEKRTALGEGHFVTLSYEFTDQHGKPVGRMRFRMLKFRPKASTGEPAAKVGSPPPAMSAGAAAAAGPPRPITTPDSAFFWEGLRAHELLIQRCRQCGRLRHPPGPRCPSCRSPEWDTVRPCGRGVIHSFAIVHQPKLPCFEYPLPVVLVQLEEGVRLLANLLGGSAAKPVVGAAVRLEFVDVAPDFVLPAFSLAADASGSGESRCLEFDDVALGQSLPPLVFPVTTSAIVAGAIATNDFARVHHDVDAARASGMPGIFMNILTTNALVQRFVTEWAGPRARVRRIALRLGAPNFAGDMMTLTGAVAALDREKRAVDVCVSGRNAIGEHVTATVTFGFAGRIA